MSRSNIVALRRGMRLLMEAAPVELRRLMLSTLLVGAGPSMLLWLGKLVIDESARLLRDGPVDDALAAALSSPTLVGAIAGFLAVNLLLDCVDTLSSFEFSSLRDRVEGVVKERIFRKIAEFEDIALFESPELLNVVQLAEQSVQRLWQWANVAGNLLTGIFTFLPAVLLSLSIAWWAPLAIFLLSLPSAYAQQVHERNAWSLEAAQAGTVRQMRLQERLLTGDEYAKELRLLRLQTRVLTRWHDLFWSAFEEVRRVRRSGTLVILGWSLLSGVGTGLPYVFVVTQGLRGNYSLGDLALYAGLLFEVRRSLLIFFGNAAQFQEIALGAAAIFRLLDLQSDLRAAAPTGAASSVAGDQADQRGAISEGIELRNVGFTYPGGSRRVLENINLNLPRGKMVVIVGENGGGKTTLAKLLCRLYDPDTGCILWDGRDLRTLDLDALRENTVVLFQDYARFPASLRENIAYGALSWLHDDAVLLRAAEGAGIGALLTQLPHGLDTPLSKQLENGVDLSGGQWQRVALARALLRRPQAQLVILDEPTAALDPRAEHEILHTLREMARGKIAVIISHRLALARVADRIVVIDGGRIVETGTHDELMRATGLYHTMFTRQASSYREEETA